MSGQNISHKVKSNLSNKDRFEIRIHKKAVLRQPHPLIVIIRSLRIPLFCGRVWSALF